MLLRCGKETQTTLSAIREAHEKNDLELLAVYDRLLNGGHKEGAWIKHIVKTVRKNPDLGSVHDITFEQLFAYADMRRAIAGVIYDKNAKKSDKEQVYDLYVFAVQYPQHVTSIIEVMRELKTVNLQSIQALITERRNTHASLVQGAL